MPIYTVNQDIRNNACNHYSRWAFQIFVKLVSQNSVISCGKFEVQEGQVEMKLNFLIQKNGELEILAICSLKKYTKMVTTKPIFDINEAKKRKK